MNPTPFQRALIFAALLVTLAATRVHHFAFVPDASWAVFFIGGFYLRRQVAWVFPSLLLLAGVVDWAVISAAGLDFWNHYCVSPGYWMLVPAYLAMWLGGAWLRRGYVGAGWPALGRLLLAVAVSTAVCHLFSQAGFYWLSDSWAGSTTAGASLAGWWKNYTDWLLPHPSVGSHGYLLTVMGYVAIGAVLQVAAEQAVRLRPRRAGHGPT